METKNEYRKVLVPVDGSDSSFHALEQAFQFSSTEKSWITVVCVAPDYEGDLDTLAVPQQRISQFDRLGRPARLTQLAAGQNGLAGRLVRYGETARTSLDADRIQVVLDSHARQRAPDGHG